MNNHDRVNDCSFASGYQHLLGIPITDWCVLSAITFLVISNDMTVRSPVPWTSAVLKHNLFSLRNFFRSATPTFLSQSTDLCSLISQYTKGLVFHPSCLELNTLSRCLGNLSGGLNGSFNDGGFSWLRSSSGFGGFLAVHFRNASTSCFLSILSNHRQISLNLL